MAVTEEQEIAMLRERIKFEMTPRAVTLEAVIMDEHLADEIRGECDIRGATAESALSELCGFVNCTKRVIFNFKGDESSLLRDFQRDWAVAEDSGGGSWWNLRLRMDYRLIRLWREAYKEATKDKPLFAAPVEQLPDDALTLEQRREAADPTSPLVKPASASAKK